MTLHLPLVRPTPSSQLTTGWYANCFSHARRVISPDPSLPADDPAVATWDGRDCVSSWALNGRGVGAGGGR
jgi:hypothetical protein